MNRDWLEIYHRVADFVGTLPEEVTGKAPIEPEEADIPDYILPFELYKGSRDNIEKIGDQINRSFHYAIYDGCAVLMRRLVETLLILTFREHGVEEEILDADGNYFRLSKLVDVAVQNKTLGFSRNAKRYFDLFREKGDLSAHNPFHIALRTDLDRAQPRFRHLIQELVYKAGIK